MIQWVGSRQPTWIVIIIIFKTNGCAHLYILLNVMYVIYVVVRIAIEMVVLTLIFLPLSPFYNSFGVCDTGRFNKLKDVNYNVHLINMVNQIQEYQLQLWEQLI